MRIILMLVLGLSFSPVSAAPLRAAPFQVSPQPALQPSPQNDTTRPIGG
ncbi:hypothetical protein [Deinococcus sp.]